MSVETSSVFTLLPAEILLLVVNVGVVTLAVLYFIFSLIVVRQINLMTETLVTEVSPLLRFLAIIHAGVVLGIIVLFIGILF